jgi:hypothetical protein
MIDVLEAAEFIAPEPIVPDRTHLDAAALCLSEQFGSSLVGLFEFSVCINTDQAVKDLPEGSGAAVPRVRLAPLWLGSKRRSSPDAGASR